MAGQERSILRTHLSDDFIDEAQAKRAGSEPGAESPPASTLPAVAPTETRLASAQALAAATPPAQEPADLEVGPLGEVELAAIRRAVEAAGGNISSAARKLGVSRNTIYRKLRWNAPR
jgi:transcriptional regulator of acetoin/glycerol metabolism